MSLARKITLSKNKKYPTGSKIGTARYNNYRSGSYYGYHYGYYDQDTYTPVQGEMCTNYNDYDGIVYEHFYCPIEGFRRDEKYCCGAEGSEYCCDYSAYKSDKDIGGGFRRMIIFVVCSLLVVLLVVIGIIMQENFC